VPQSRPGYERLGLASDLERLGLGLASDLNASVSPRTDLRTPRSRLDRSPAHPCYLELIMFWRLRKHVQLCKFLSTGLRWPTMIISNHCRWLGGKCITYHILAIYHIIFCLFSFLKVITLICKFDQCKMYAIDE